MKWNHLKKTGAPSSAALRAAVLLGLTVLCLLGGLFFSRQTVYWYRGSLHGSNWRYITSVTPLPEGETGDLMVFTHDKLTGGAYAPDVFLR